MDLMSYVRKLNPAIERKEVIQTITSLREELETYTRPISNDIVVTMKDHTFKGTLEKRLGIQLKRFINFNGSPIAVTDKAITNMSELLDILEARAKKIFSFQFSTFNISYERAGFLQLLDAMMFYIHAHRRIMLEILQEENRLVGAANPVKWSRGFKLFVEEGLTPYSELTRLFVMSPREFGEKVANLSNAMMSDETHELAVRTLGALKTDPFSLQRNAFFKLNFFSNPTFSLGKARAERQVKRYRLMKEETEGLRLRLQEYRYMMEEGKVDPAFQKLIQRTEERIENLNYQLVQFEEANSMDD